MLNILRFAQADEVPVTDLPSDPTVIQPLTDGQAEVSGAAAAGIGIFSIILSLFALVNFIFFVLAIIHLIKNPNVPNRILWIVLCLLIPYAATFYYFVPRKSYNKSAGGGAAPQVGGVPASQYQNPAQGYAPPVATQGQPSPTYSDVSATPVTPATTIPVAPQVAAAPENPVQLPQNPDPAPTNSFEAPPAQEFQPSVPQTPQQFEPTQDPTTPQVPGAEPTSPPPQNQNPSSQA